MSGTVHRATLREKVSIAADVVEFLLELSDEDRGLSWRAGQFVSVTCGRTADDLPLLRSYTIASLPDEERLRLVLKLVPGGGASEWFRALRVGDEVTFTGPMGFFVLDLAHGGDVVFAATGTGIAPFVPMARELLRRGEAGAIHCHWGLRDESDLFWRAELDELARASGGRFRTTISLSRPSGEWAGERGRINARLFELVAGLARPTFYLCGNGAMIADVKAGLVERGVDRKRQIRTEAFFK